MANIALEKAFDTTSRHALLWNLSKHERPEQSWWIFKGTFQRAQELSIPLYTKLGKAGKRQE